VSAADAKDSPILQMSSQPALETDGRYEAFVF
jgi:hypothetical protein